MPACSLCQGEITDYRPEYHHLVIDEAHSVDLCQDCIDKIIKWRRQILVNLFPTKLAKKWAKK